jgi:ABC-type nickel/cobalt efflux system permease component RcnA
VSDLLWAWYRLVAWAGAAGGADGKRRNEQHAHIIVSWFSSSWPRSHHHHSVSCLGRVCVCLWLILFSPFFMELEWVVLVSSSFNSFIHLVLTLERGRHHHHDCCRHHRAEHEQRDGGYWWQRGGWRTCLGALISLLIFILYHESVGGFFFAFCPRGGCG